MWSRIALLGVVWLFFGTAAATQGQTGSIKGFISDDLDARLPGVMVTATGPALMGTRTATSDQQGFYRLLDLPPGSYHVEAQLAGFAPFEQRDLAIQAGLSIQLDFTMKIGDLAETIEVRDEAPLLEAEKATRTLHLDGDFLRALPLTPGHDWWDASTLAPGVLLRHGAADAVETHGAAVSSNVFLIDGIDVSDPGQNTPFGTYLPPDAVEQIAMTTSGHDGASRMAVGAQFAVVTRSGGNQTHGALTIDLQPRTLNATNVPGGTPAGRSIARPAVSLGGALIRDRLWYFGAYRYIRERNGLARTDDELAALRLFQPGFVPYDSRLRQHQSLTKVTFQASAANQLVLSVQFDHTRAANLGFPRSTRERALGSRSLGPVYSGTWRRSIGRRASLEAQAGLYSKSSEFLPQGEGPNIRVYSSVVSSQGRQFGSGPLIVEMGNVPTVVQSPTGRRSNVNGTLRYAPGAWGRSHELTLGLNLLPATEYSNLNVSSNGGFVSEERVRVDPADQAAATRAFHRQYQNPVALPTEGKSSRAAGLFAQDSWRPGPRWVVNAGVRFDWAEAFDTLGDEVQRSWQIGPRFGVTYRLTGDGRTIVRGGVNRIHDAINTFYV
ncbi:MAG: TonB-dependent receptor domain-containing protein, partial [Vicinamibacterales bacterium]